MSTITTRTAKGAELLFSELDANFENLNNDKLETSVHDAHVDALAVDAHPATAISFYDLNYVSATVSDAISETFGFINAHLNDTADAHDASAISRIADSFYPEVTQSVQDALTTISEHMQAHTGYTGSLPHTASEISFGGGIYSDVQAAIDGHVSDLNGEIGGHVNDTDEAHYATAIGFASAGDLSSTNVSAALDELNTEKVNKANSSVTNALEVRGSHTPSGGGALELHYLTGEAYIQALDRTGTVWKPVRFQGSVINLNPNNSNIASCDTAGFKLVTGANYYVSGTAVVGARKTGWAAATGTATRTTFATTTVTTEQLAQRVKALIDDLISHGLIGT